MPKTKSVAEKPAKAAKPAKEKGKEKPAKKASTGTVRQPTAVSQIVAAVGVNRFRVRRALKDLVKAKKLKVAHNERSRWSFEPAELKSVIKLVKEHVSA